MASLPKASIRPLELLGRANRILPDWELELVGGSGSLLEAADATLAVSVDPGVEEVEEGVEVFVAVAGVVAAAGEV
ncbi:hypothetical protein [Planctopirus ephydatiae]|uniref:hypothetical protein n=1 Tax=Planctopirus ephydatiae TaxID=2528019 RepID=UPI001643F9F7|nr:hypothetical protein [Planctopirus ephydatiae]